MRVAGAEPRKAPQRTGGARPARAAPAAAPPPTCRLTASLPAPKGAVTHVPGSPARKRRRAANRPVAAEGPAAPQQQQQHALRRCSHRKAAPSSTPSPGRQLQQQHHHHHLQQDQPHRRRQQQQQQQQLLHGRDARGSRDTGPHAGGAGGEAEECEEGEEDEEEDEEDEEANSDESDELRRAAQEAAALCSRPRAAAAGLPHGLPASKLQAAVAYLASNAGLEAAAAEECLLATAEHWRAWDVWMDECMMWIANKQEDEEEAAKLREVGRLHVGGWSGLLSHFHAPPDPFGLCSLPASGCGASCKLAACPPERSGHRTRGGRRPHLTNC
jgi:hypothetical protein